MTRLIRRFARDDGGATAIEYGIVGALIFLTIVSGFRLFAGNSTSGFNGAMASVVAALS